MSEEYIEVEEEPVPPNTNWTEQRRMRGRDLADNVKKIAKEANVRRITVNRPDGTTLVDIPMGVGLVGMALLPRITTLLAGVGILKEYSVNVERERTAESEDTLVSDVEAAIEKAKSKAQEATDKVRERAVSVATKASEKTADMANRIDAAPQAVAEAPTTDDDSVVDDLIAKYSGAESAVEEVVEMVEPDLGDLDRLVAVNGVGPALAKKLLAEFGSADAVKSAKAKEIAVVRGVSEKLAKVIKKSL